MTLARIITRNPQDAFAVSEYLRSEGYTVETVSPAEFRITPAELELDLNRCKRGAAVARAKAMVASRRGMAPVEQEAPTAPEPALPKKAKVSVAYDIVGRPVAFADEEEPERNQGPRSTRNALASALSRLMAPVRELQQWSAENRALKLEAGQERRREQELARERARQEMERRRVEAERAEQRRQEQVAAEQQAEQERARAALVRNATIAAAGTAARKKQAETVAGEKPAEQAQTEPASVENLVRQQLPVRRPARSFVARRRTSTVLRRVTTAVLGASFMAFIGYIAYANRRPASPLSPGALMMNGSIKQEVPFGPVTITPPAAAVPKPSPVVKGRVQPAVRPAYKKFGASRQQTSASTAEPKQHSDTD
jgi:hypothetical protein